MRLDRPPKAVIFNLDGTLVDSAPGLLVATNALLREARRPPIFRPDLERMVGEGALMLIARAFAATGPSVDPQPYLPRWLELYDALGPSGTTLFTGARETLTALDAAGCALGLCTNKPQRPTETLLTALSLDGAFQVVLGGDAVPRRKPDPDHVLQVLGGLGVAPSEAVFIGDSPADAAAARAAGVPLVLMSHGYSRQPLRSLGADHIVDDFASLRALLTR